MTREQAIPVTTAKAAGRATRGGVRPGAVERPAGAGKRLWRHRIGAAGIDREVGRRFDRRPAAPGGVVVAEGPMRETGCRHGH